MMGLFCLLHASALAVIFVFHSKHIGAIFSPFSRFLSAQSSSFFFPFKKSIVSVVDVKVFVDESIGFEW